jgi:hypothetical protein
MEIRTMVTRQIELTEEQNETLEQLAASQGRPVSDLLRAGVDVILKISVPSHPGAPHLTARESELLLEINRGLSVEAAERYRHLMALRRRGTLSSEEYRELLHLTDEAERLQAERIESLSELAHLRGKPLDALMEELGIRPS